MLHKKDEDNLTNRRGRCENQNPCHISGMHWRKSATDMIWELTSDGIGDYVAGNGIVPNHGVFKEIQYETKIRHHQG
jgi:hypothetical protein